MTNFEATSDFASALLEVDLLINMSSSHPNNPDFKDALNKAAILLLMAKIESFLEQIIEEYCFQLSELKLVCNKLPRALCIHASRHLLNEGFFEALNHNKEEKIIPVLESLALMWHNGCVPKEIKVDCSFTYGKHGEKEIRRLFQRIGIIDVFQECKISDDRESIDTNDPNSSYEIAADINALTGYRNYIIHNDGTPNVTYDQILLYRKHFFAFAEKIDQCLAQLKKNIHSVTAPMDTPID